MSKSHNKKRNTGLLYEFLVGSISRSLIENKQPSSTKAIKILKKYFKPGTELYKEFRLINALLKTTVTSEATAASIIQEAKAAVRTYNLQELDKQKSLLIRDINHSINDEHFYDFPIKEYRFLASLQSLINEWRNPNCDLGAVAQYEDQLLKHLITNKTVVVEESLNQESPGTSRLLMKIMMNKLNEKYSHSLSDTQKALLRAYAFSSANDDPKSIEMKLTEIKSLLLNKIDEFLLVSNNAVINEKLTLTKTQLLSESIDDKVNDELVTKFMLYTELTNELTSKDNTDDD